MFPLGEYAARRAALAARMPPNSMAIVLAYKQRKMGHDIPYVFRQQPDFLYLTGFNHPSAVAVIEKSKTNATKFSMFAPYDPKTAFDEGTPSSPAQLQEIFGADNGYARVELQDFLRETVPSKDHVLLPDMDDSSADALRELRSNPAVKGLPSSVSGTSTQLVHQLRLVKSRAEIEAMRRACSASALGFKDTINYFASKGKVKKGPVSERLLGARLEFSFVEHGGEAHAYPPVVAGGHRGTTIHYVSNSKSIEVGEMVLVDAGAYRDGYNGDITRTWPIDGRFTEPQLELYSAVLRVQLALIEAIKSKKVGTLHRLHLLSGQLVYDELRKLGFGEVNSTMMDTLYPHLVGHYLGMDIHDTDSVSSTHALQPGMIVTIEPGIYVPNLAFYPSRYRGLAVRIEDDVLITPDGCEVLTHEAPKHVEELRELAKK